MSEYSKIEWCDHTWNAWEGCQKAGLGCDHCYAESRNARYAGGVAANRGLRARMAEVCARREIGLFVPPFASCTDNAAMIAYAGALRLARGERDGASLGPSTKTALLRVTRKGGGARV